MAGKIVLLDTSILIEFFRKTDKTKSALMKLALQGHSFNISAITEYEIFSGATGNQETYWEEFLMKTEVLAFDKTVSKKAVEINRKLKKKRKQIAIPDLFIAATALAFQLPLATLNKKHFERVEGLELLEI